MFIVRGIVTKSIELRLNKKLNSVDLIQDVPVSVSISPWAVVE